MTVKPTATAKAPVTVSAVALVSVLSVAGCGGSSDPRVAHLSSDGDASPARSPASSENGGSSPETKAIGEQAMVAFAKCMRSHGEPNFPEPAAEGHIAMKASPGSSQNPGSPQFQAAQQQCRKLLPNGGAVSPQMRKQAEERALKFAACMRSHGEPNFPAPEFSSSGGGFHVTISGPRSGIDLNSPQFKAARQACKQYFGPPGSKGGPSAAPSGGGEQTNQTVGP